MNLFVKIVLFGLTSLPVIWVSRSSLRDFRLHGFYRFFAWETILVLFLLNMDYWFVDPFGLRQIVAWLFLVISLVLILMGVTQFRRLGKLDRERGDPGLVGIEKTTRLVTSGIYRRIRHPFYSSLLFLAWGILIKRLSWPALILTAGASLFLVVTARREEIENEAYFGEAYAEYGKQTKMFIPGLF